MTAYARALAQAVSGCEYGESTVVDVRARVPYLEEVAAESAGRPRKTSLEHLNLLARVRINQSRDSNTVCDAGIRVSHIVACPCVQKVYQYTRALGRAECAPADRPGPTFTHSQRCLTTVIVEGMSEPLPVASVLRRLDAMLVRIMNTLPRGSELAMVYRAHQTPQFVEDPLREALCATYQGLGHGRFTRLRGRSTSIESIHEFDLSAAAILTSDAARRLLTPAAAVEQ